MLNGGLLAFKSGQPSQPENARSSEVLGCQMIEKNGRFAYSFTHVKIILHEEENVHVVRFRLAGDKRTIKDETRQATRLLNEFVDDIRSASRR
jgi:hypothetical protein